MESKQPTPEQIKEFWEKFGFKDGSGYLEGDIDIVTVICPDRTIIHEYPPIDLNNLFKYAEKPTIKKIQENWHEHHEGYLTDTGARQELLMAWLFKIAAGLSHEDALFWVVWEVIHERS